MFEYKWKCAWGEADPMGIAYYPRLVNAVHLAGEEFMVDLGTPYWDLPEEYEIFLPVVALEMEFGAPVEVGDVLTISVEPDIGNTSLGLEYTATHEDGTEAYTGREQHVCVDAENHQSQPLPEEFKEILAEASE